MRAIGHWVGARIGGPLARAMVTAPATVVLFLLDLRTHLAASLWPRRVPQVTQVAYTGLRQ